VGAVYNCGGCLYLCSVYGRLHDAGTPIDEGLFITVFCVHNCVPSVAGTRVINRINKSYRIRFHDAGISIDEGLFITVFRVYNCVPSVAGSTTQGYR